MYHIPPKKRKKINWIAPSRSQLIQSHFKGSQGVIIERGRQRETEREREREREKEITINDRDRKKEGDRKKEILRKTDKTDRQR